LYISGFDQLNPSPGYEYTTKEPVCKYQTISCRETTEKNSASPKNSFFLLPIVNRIISFKLLKEPARKGIKNRIKTLICRRITINPKNRHAQRKYLNCFFMKKALLKYRKAVIPKRE
jgi:hypothetical protein